MRLQGIPALLSLRFCVALFSIGCVAAAAQVPGQQPDGMHKSLAVSVPALPDADLASIPAEASAPSSAPALSLREKVQAALANYERVLAWNRTRGNREQEAEDLAGMASAYRAIQQEHKAANLFQSAISIFHELGNREYEAAAVAHMGDVYREWGFPDTAQNFYRKALGIYSAATDQEGEAAALNNSGVAWLTLNNRKKCLESLHLAMASYQADHDRQGEALASSNLGAAYLYFSENPEKALPAFQGAVATMEALGDKAGEANALDMMGFTLLEMHREKMANMAFEHARDLFRTLGDGAGEARVSSHIGRVGSENGSGTRRMRVAAESTPDPLILTAARLQVEEVAR